MCDKITTALAAQALSALSVNDYKGAWKLVEELKKRWSMEKDPQQFRGDKQQKADHAHSAEHLKLKVR